MAFIQECSSSHLIDLEEYHDVSVCRIYLNRFGPILSFIGNGLYHSPMIVDLSWLCCWKGTVVYFPLAPTVDDNLGRYTATSTA